MVPILTLAAIFMLFYATCYLIFGGMVFLVAWATWIIVFDAPDRTQTLWIWTAFFTVGILQRYIRHRLFDPPKEPKPKQLAFVQQLNQDRLERLTSQYDAMSRKDRDSMIRLYGDNFFAWPEPWPQSNTESAPESDAAHEDDEELSRHYATLGVQTDAAPEEVKQAYRDLAKVWHPDRFDDGDTRLKQKAEEQLKVINDAYARIQGHQLTPSSSGTSEIEKQESKHEVRSEQELKDVIDATRRKVDETTKEISDFLEQMKKREHTSLERL
jgi:DnaJ-domain-containing protein 1